MVEVKCSLGRPPVQLSGRSTGVLIALLGTMVDSPEALIVRRMGELLEDGPSVTHHLVVFHKYLWTAVFTLIVAVSFARGFRNLRNGFYEGPLHILAAAVWQVLISIMLTLSLLETETASVYLLYLLAPLWAALFGRVFLREPIRRYRHPTAVCSCTPAWALRARSICNGTLRVLSPSAGALRSRSS